MDSIVGLTCNNLGSPYYWHVTYFLNAVHVAVAVVNRFLLVFSVPFIRFLNS